MWCAPAMSSCRWYPSPTSWWSRHQRGRRRKVYTLVIIETDLSYLGTAENPRQITAGMQATVEILTGTRSVLQYLIRPIQKAREGAFKER